MPGGRAAIYGRERMQFGSPFLAPQARAAEAERADLHLRFAVGPSVLKFKKWITNILQAFKMGAMST